MRYIYCINICVLLCLVHKTNSWQYFTTLSELTLTGTTPDTLHRHSEYLYGDCTTRHDKIFYGHTHLENINVLGKLIVRGWVDLFRMPTCIILKGRAYEEDTFRNTAYRFQFCVPRITYCHSRRRYKYFYYEWYIPSEMIGGMTWDIYYYGPANKQWH